MGTLSMVDTLPLGFRHAEPRRGGLGSLSLACIVPGLRAQRSKISTRLFPGMSDVPEDCLLEADGEKLLRLEAHLAERIVGHTPALTRIAQVLRRLDACPCQSSARLVLAPWLHSAR